MSPILRGRIIAALLLLALFVVGSVGVASAFASNDPKPKAPLDTPTATGTPTLIPTPVCSTLAGSVVASASYVYTYGLSFRGMAVISPDDVWTVGEGVDSQIMHWSGTTWYPVGYPQGGISQDGETTFDAISGASANDIWVVGGYWDSFDYHHVVTEHWDGSGWRLVPNPDPFGGDPTLNAVQAISSDDAWAVGNTGDHALIFHWDGSTWNSVPEPPGLGTARLYGVSAVSSDAVWAVGTAIIHWNGTAWSTVDLPSGFSGTMSGVSADAHNDVWVTGLGPTGTAHWDGTNWNSVTGPPHPLAVHAISPSDVWVVGDTVGHWNGATWTYDTPPVGGLLAIDADSSTDVWVGGSGAARWAGAQWVETLGGLVISAANTLRGISALSSDDVWAVGYGTRRFPGWPSEDAAIIEHWDGTQWQLSPTSSNLAYLYGVVAVSSNDVWVDGNGIDGCGVYAQALTKHWNGTEWRGVDTPNIEGTHNYLTSISAISADDIWAAGYYGLPGSEQPLMLHYDGVEWSTAPSVTVGSAAYLAGVDAISSDDVWAVGRYKPTPSSPEQTLTMHWDGSQWSQVPSPNIGSDNNKLWSVSAFTSDDVWAVGYYGPSGSGHTLTLHWDGSQWAVITSPNPGSGGYLFSVKATSPNRVWAVGNYFNPSTGTAQTLALSWDGTRWSVAPSVNVGSDSNYLYAVGPVIDNQVWAVGSYSVNNHLSNGQSLTLAEQFDPPTFADVRPTDYFYEAVQYLSCHGAISGYSDSTFRPYNDTTRGQLTKIVVLAEEWDIDTGGGPHFSDVPPDNPFYDYIETSYNRGIISGYSDGTFRWGNNVTRGQLCKIIVLTEGWPPINPPTPTFRDVPAGSTFYGFIETAYSRGIISGYSCGVNCLEFRPGNNATRGQISKIVYNAITVGPPLTRTPTITRSPTDTRLPSDTLTPTSTRTRTATPTSTYTVTGTPPTQVPTCSPAWSFVDSPDSGPNLTLGGIAHLSATDIWAVGSAGNSPAQTLVTHWDGAQWRRVQSPNVGSSHNGLNDVKVLSATNVWAVGWYRGDNGIERTLIEHWDGSAWSVVPSPNAEGGSVLNAVSAVSATDIWAVGYSGATLDCRSVDEPLAEHWDGQAWSVVATPIIAAQLADVAAIATDNSWAVGWRYDAATGYDQMLILHWDGIRWSTEPIPYHNGSQLAAITAISDDDIWAAGTAMPEEQPLMLHWDGSAWSVIPSPGPTAWLLGVNGVSAVSSGDVWAAGDYDPSSIGPRETLTLHWDGTQWSVVPSPNREYYDYVNGVTAISQYDVWVVGAFLDTGPLLLHYSNVCLGPTSNPTGIKVPKPTATGGSAVPH